MDEINDTGPVQRTSEITPPSLLVIVLDTNPYAWSTLSPYLPLSKAVADLLVFINAHLAFNHANRVAVIASHCGQAAWLYPSPSSKHENTAGNPEAVNEEHENAPRANPNKYRPFALVEQELMHNLRKLLNNSTTADLLASPTSTMLAGALTLALSYINKTLITLGGSGGNAASSTANPDAIGTGAGPAAAVQSQNQTSSSLTSRILIVSTTGDLAAQYIPMMNLMFAAQHSNIPIDILKLAGDTVLLQQASYTTSGVFLTPALLPPPSQLTSEHANEPNGTTTTTTTKQPLSLLPTLFFAFLPDPTARTHLFAPTGINVDFRAACFCHRRVVSIGYVCSICLSIFCEDGVKLGIQAQAQAQQQEPGDGTMATTQHGSVDTGACLTCGTPLSLKVLYGAGSESLVLDGQPRGKKKKKKRRMEGEAGGGAGDALSTGANTPVPG